LLTTRNTNLLFIKQIFCQSYYEILRDVSKQIIKEAEIANDILSEERVMDTRVKSMKGNYSTFDQTMNNEFPWQFPPNGANDGIDSSLTSYVSLISTISSTSSLSMEQYEDDKD
jgi:hypothetical protein